MVLEQLSFSQDYLSVGSQKWYDDVGAGKSVPWPNGLTAAGNEGVAGIVKSTEYSVEPWLYTTNRNVLCLNSKW